MLYIPLNEPLEKQIHRNHTKLNALDVNLWNALHQQTSHATWMACWNLTHNPDGWMATRLKQLVINNQYGR